MQDLKALEGKSLAELREIGKALGIPHLMMKKKDLIEKILNFTQDGGVADTETQQSPAEAPKKTRRPRIAKTESTQASVEIREQPAAQTTTTPTPAAPKEGGKRRGPSLPQGTGRPFIRRHRYFQTRDKKNRPGRRNVSRNARGTADTPHNASNGRDHYQRRFCGRNRR